jgi:CxxC motif-containing protein (DUF1111 family)
LFAHEWTVGDPKSARGDGLGPVYNEHSCLACHNLGGAGGAGTNEKNVSILAVRRTADLKIDEINRLAKVHPGFRKARSVVLHRFGPDADYQNWRWKVLGSDRTRGVSLPAFLPRSVTIDNQLVLDRVERNTPAIFGAGRIDALPEAVIEEAAERAHPWFPEIKGRVSRFPDGRIGRFGWKAQVASLEDFVMSACAGELGLAVAGHPQPQDPRLPEQDSTLAGLDMSSSQVNALVEYVRGLPAPVVTPPRSLTGLWSVNLGKAVFEEIGCAECHTPNLGQVEGIYSDLLLHDMGTGDSESGEYYGQSPAAGSNLLANAQEWRTAPLWGLQASKPYMHDGRSRTIRDAIRRHGGEAARTVERFNRLGKPELRALTDFLLSLKPPKVEGVVSEAAEMPVSHVPGEPLFNAEPRLAANGVLR